MSFKSGSKHTPVLWKSYTSFDLFCMSQFRVTYSTTQKNLFIFTCTAEPVQTSVETLRQMFGPNWFYVHSLPYLLISFVKFITILAYIFPKFCYFYKYIQTCMNTQSVLFTIFIWHVTLIEWFSLYIQNVNGVKTPSLFIDFAIAVWCR